MKSAELFLEALDQGLSPIEALHSLPEYEQRYIRRVTALPMNLVATIVAGLIVVTRRSTA